MAQGALESSLATAVGPASVSILADSIFGYKFGDVARADVILNGTYELYELCVSSKIIYTTVYGLLMA